MLLCQKLFNDHLSAYRLNNFYVWLSNTKPTVGEALKGHAVIKCAQYDGSLAVGEVVSVQCIRYVEKFKYLIIQSSLTTVDALCFGEVEVFSGKQNVSLLNWIC